MDADIESRIRETGYRLYDLMEGEAGSIFSREYWVGKLFEWCMHNEAFRVQMLRFIDVFPYLKDSDAVIGHIQQYFSDPAINFPSAVNWGIKYVAPSWMTSRIIAGGIGINIAKVARQFIAGTSAKDSRPVLQRLRSAGLAFTIDLLGEAVVSEKEADGYVERYLELFDFLDSMQRKWRPLGGVLGGLDWGLSPRVNVSVKVSAMYSQMNACAFEHSIEKSKERLRQVLRRAMKAGAFVNLDMEHHGLKDITLALYRSIMEEAEFRTYPHTGIVIQAYLRESEKDLDRMFRWAHHGDFHFTIRLVKGAYWDQEVISARQRNWPVPVFTDKSETDAYFEHLAWRILENGSRIKLACASHNIRSIAAVAEMAKQAGPAGKQVEFQVLYGMGQPVRNALRKTGLRVRVYCPVGEMLQGMSYLVRRLLENTANESFLRQAFSERLSRAELVRDPAVRLKSEKILHLLAEHPKDTLRTSSLPRVAGQNPSELPGTMRQEASEDGVAGPFRIEPLFDWSLAEHRLGFSAAIRSLRERFPIQVPLQIGGSRIETSSRFVSVNPNNAREMVGTVSSARVNEAELAVAAAKSAFPGWRDIPPRERANYLFKAAASARLKRYELAALQTLEVGKSWSESDADVCEAIDYLEYYGREMLRYGRPRPMGGPPGETSLLLYEPRGVAVVIAPWNFPLAISTGMCSAAMVTGNTVVYKPASQSPVTGFMLNGLFEDAGLPKGVFNFVPGPGATMGDALTGHPDVALIAFTGSREVGLRILEKAHQTNERSGVVKNVILEMGGKNAIIVDSDADLDEAVVYVLQSAFGYQGQKCSACSRLIVEENIYDRFMERLKEAARSIEIGPVEFPGNFMGAVIDDAAKEKIRAYVEIGKNAGYPLFEHSPAGIKDTKPDFGDNGYFVPLSIFTDVDPESRLAQEEIFGPVLAVIKVKDFDEALRVANGTQYALTGGVLSRSPVNIRKARESFRTGNLYINRGCTGAIVGRHPFGGFKMSGLGLKAGGPDYLLHFMIARNIVENTVRKGFAPTEDGEAWQNR
jgi:RHH-type proline utilization regulon transcriptional repressor/proline dehydrogenase/delta 1-pyrroline-5-carboxylate dehydrogenase